MHDAESIGDEGSHEGCKLIISYSRLTHSVQLLHMSIHTLQVGCSHHSQGSSQAMPREHNSITSVDGVEVIDVLLHLRLHAVEALIEANVDRAAIAEGITGADSLEIEDPVCSVHASSEGDDHALVLRRVADIAVNAVRIIGNYLYADEINALTHRTRPALNQLLRFVGDGREVGQLRGQMSAV